MEIPDGVNGRPGDERGFLHKKIFGAIGNIASILPIPGGGIISSISRRIAGIGGQPPPRQPTFTTQLPPVLRHIPGGGSGACRPGLIRAPSGQCVSPASPFGAGQLEGIAVMGRFGPAVAPAEEIRSIAVCPTGMALGKDSLCYDHLPNRDRKYPRGRRPLLTGGDMRAISRARRAGNRLGNAKADLIAIGMLKPAGTRRRKKKAVACA